MPIIAQDPLYHLFADTRTLAGVPNFWNVASNAAFLLAAAYGLARRYTALALGTAGVALGSAWYHLRPCDSTLFWDRLPMAFVFGTLIAEVAGWRRAAVPLASIGVASVMLWRANGELLPYVAIQFGGMLAIALFARGNVRIWGMLGFYVLAKLLEAGDQYIAGLIAAGGHPLKHLAAALAIGTYFSSPRSEGGTNCGSGLRLT